MSNLRNSQLLQQMQAHPLKATLAKALDIAEAFAGDVQFLQLDKNLSDAGIGDAVLSAPWRRSRGRFRRWPAAAFPRIGG